MAGMGIRLPSVIIRRLLRVSVMENFETRQTLPFLQVGIIVKQKNGTTFQQLLMGDGCS